MNQNTKYGLGGLVIGAIVVSLISTIGSTNFFRGTGRMMGGYSASIPTKTENSETIDAHFIEQMIPHHEDAITMARLAVQKTKRSEVKQLAESIIESQGKEIVQMKQWYKGWYGQELSAGEDVMKQHGMMESSGMHMGMMGNEMDLKNLEEAVDFDKEFVSEMIPHHQMAVMMASMLKSGTARPEMKKLSDDIITAQTSEIALMRGWLREWNK